MAHQPLQAPSRAAAAASPSPCRVPALLSPTPRHRGQGCVCPLPRDSARDYYKLLASCNGIGRSRLLSSSGVLQTESWEMRGGKGEARSVIQQCQPRPQDRGHVQLWGTKPSAPRSEGQLQVRAKRGLRAAPRALRQRGLHTLKLL